VARQRGGRCHPAARWRRPARGRLAAPRAAPRRRLRRKPQQRAGAAGGCARSPRCAPGARYTALQADPARRKWVACAPRPVGSVLLSMPAFGCPPQATTTELFESNFPAWLIGSCARQTGATTRGTRRHRSRAGMRRSSGSPTTRTRAVTLQSWSASSTWRCVLLPRARTNHRSPPTISPRLSPKSIRGVCSGRPFGSRLRRSSLRRHRRRRGRRRQGGEICRTTRTPSPGISAKTPV